MYLIKYTPWIYKPSWLNYSDAKNWQRKIINKTQWEQPSVKVYSRLYKVPRLTCFLADDGISYIYSGIKHIGKGWPDWFFPLLENVRNTCGTKFNGCLLNLYRDGNDCMGWHSDNEKELDPQKSIASLSLGSTRDFILKERKTISKEKLSLSTGDLLIMHPECQKNWIHSLPRRKKIIGNRVNLTFRAYI